MNAENLIGKRVRHKKTRSIGRIESIHDHIITVDFEIDKRKFQFPSCFASTLELEDETLKEAFKEQANSASFDNFKHLYKMSVEKEINYLKKEGGKQYKVVDGERIPVSNPTIYVYTFDSDQELHFPDNTPIRIAKENTFISGSILYCDDYSVTLEAENDLGTKLNVIEFIADVSFLWQALYDRLDHLTPIKDEIPFSLVCDRQNMIDKYSTQLLNGQNSAICHVKENPITFIWGPPGTGKTETLAKIVLDFLDSGKRVLMISYSNVSVDGAILRVADKSNFHPGVLLRYGYPRTDRLLGKSLLSSYQYVLSQNPQLSKEYDELKDQLKRLKKNDTESIRVHKRLKQIRTMLRDNERDAIKNAGFVATTVSKAVADSGIYEQLFDLVLFDEASMAYVPQIIYASSLAKSRFCCLGDFNQLPAIVQSPDNEVLAKDIFEFTGITEAVEKGCNHKWLVMLKIQYRMHPEIADFVNKRIYHNLLCSDLELEKRRQKIADFEPVGSKPIVTVDLSGMYSSCHKTMDGSHINLLSAFVDLKIAQQAASHYKVGIITPYSAQARLINALIRDFREVNSDFENIVSATVHQFQGSEKPIIIYDAVDCYFLSYPGVLLTNKYANRLFNVAMTRAQGKFILVANKDFYKRKKINEKLLFTNVLNETEKKQQVIEGDDLLSFLENGTQDSSFFPFGSKDTTWQQYLSDLSLAKKSVSIDIPGFLDEDDQKCMELKNILHELDMKNVDIEIRTHEDNDIPEFLEKYRKSFNFVSNPLTIIDRKTLWYGQPLASMDFIVEGDPIPTEFFPIVRVQGYHAIRQIMALMELTGE